MSNLQEMGSLHELEETISDAISRIQERKVTPKKSGIGQMFSALQVICPDTHSRLLSIYKPIAVEYFENKPQPKEKKKVALSGIEKSLAVIEKNLSFEEEDFDDLGNLLPDVWDRTMLDACNRIEGKKKKPVPVKTEKDPSEPQVRDRRGYEFRGNVYGKGPLVLAVVRCVVDANPEITSSKLKNIFPDELLKSYGIFKPTDVALEASKKRKRYFLKEEQLISVQDCQIAVCNQFTSGNIGAFIEKAREIGYDIKEEDA